MNEKKSLSRRKFAKRSIMAGAALFIPNLTFPSKLKFELTKSSEDLQIFIFSKHLQFLNYKDMCDAAKEMGFDGVDLTVRPKGHVFPEHVKEDLTKATEFMKQFGLNPYMFSSNVIDADEPVQRNVLETASHLGYEIYRPAWIRYSKKDPKVIETLKIAQKKFSDLAELNKELGITASYHNHSGNFYGSAIWDLYQGIEKLSPKYFGCQYDICHATIEGGKNWEFNLNLIKNRINSLVVKDFIWSNKSGTWKPEFVPLGEGMINFRKYFSLLKQYKINVPLSIHVEYDLGGAEYGNIPNLDKKEVLKRIKKDLDYVKRIWKEIE